MTMSTPLIWGTVIVVLAIFVLFSYVAYSADKIVAAKASAKREALAKPGNKNKSQNLKT
jgi:hypothetical protein